MNAYEHLRTIALFSGLDDDAIRALADRAAILKFRAGDAVATQDETIQAFHIILEGRVKIYRSNQEGREQILYLIGGGQPFCFCTAFSDRPYPVNVTALEDTIIASIPARAMEDLATKHPLLMLKIMQTLAARLLETMNMVESLSLRGTPERVAYYLAKAEEQAGAAPGEPFTLPMAHKELAKVIGTTPETLSRIVQRFRRQGLIEASGKNLRILDATGLASVAVE